MEAANKKELIEKLRQDILVMQGFRPVLDYNRRDTGLGSLEHAFPNQIFPVAAVHEFISPTVADAAATTGFMAGLMGHLMPKDGTCLWVGTGRQLFPPGLRAFGLDPDRIIFVDLQWDRDVLWAVEEALKCEKLTVVVAELKEINLTESRRLQLAVEKSRVTGFLHRRNPRKIDNIACVSRWQITPVVSNLYGLPGVGHPCWNVDLQKVRNGQPGNWQLQWVAGHFKHIAPATTADKQKNFIHQAV
ncbi:ImuA family protein [Pedobacter steynii]|uniref:Error-prone repair protein ImuA n=1 Tax=Pedobacter steynii TaxID=430522 RepID=A0A1D7QMW0_9SPHI|nr:Error-prone repair protein ImuA [Pedobacter steynii]AOM80005.1 Error-prone repair protein ImuA [Pedobacter steynii]